MILSKDGETLPFGQDVRVEIDGGTYDVSYASLVQSGTLREQCGVTVVQPPAPTLAERKTAKIAAIRAKRWSCHQSVIFAGKAFAADDTATLRLTAAIEVRETAQTLGMELPTATAGWEASDGTFVQMTLTEQRQLLLTGGAKIQACFDRQAVLIGQVNGAASVTALNAIDIESGWPA